MRRLIQIFMLIHTRITTQIWTTLIIHLIFTNPLRHCPYLRGHGRPCLARRCALKETPEVGGEGVGQECGQGKRGRGREGGSEGWPRRGRPSLRSGKKSPVEAVRSRALAARERGERGVTTVLLLFYGEGRRRRAGRESCVAWSSPEKRPEARRKRRREEGKGELARDARWRRRRPRREHFSAGASGLGGAEEVARGVRRSALK